jgi:8-oxo-dGTP pyrophosphatase MutT (NUDIX family)
MPWGPATSKQFAKSKNVFVRMTGLARDVMDNYWSCPVDRHWGPRGGAGVIPFTVIDGQVMVLMSHRGNFVEQGGTWSSFGGAIDPGDKSPFAGAVRETFEEVDGLPGKGDVVANFKRPCHACGWTYHTFVIRVKGDPKSLLKAKVRAGHSAWETQGVAWVPVNLVGYYDLHPGFAKTWPEARQAIMKAVKEGK